MPVNRSRVEMEHILCQTQIVRRLSFALNDLSMKSGRRTRVRNSEFAPFRPSYRTARRWPHWHSTERITKDTKTEKSHAKTQSRLPPSSHIPLTMADKSPHLPL